MELVTALENSYRGIMAGKDLIGARIGETEKAWTREIVAENLFTNPNLVGDGSYATVAENLFTNPRLVGDGTWAEVRRNYSTNPSFESAVWQSQSGAETLLDDTRSRFGDSSMRLTRDTDGVFSVFRAPGAGSDWAVAPGEQWGLSYYVYSPKPAQFRVQARWQTGIAWGTGFTSHAGPVVDVPANEWTRVEGVLTVPDTATYAQASVLSVTSFGEGEPVWVDGFQVERDLVTPYFDGSTPDFSVDPDMRIRWLGEPNESQSVMEIERVAGFPGVNSIAGVSTWAGKPAIRVIPSGASNASIAYTMVPVSALSLTGVGAVAMVEPLQGELNSHALSLDIGGASDIAPNLPGSHLLQVSGGEPDGGYAVLTLVNGASQGNGEVWWTDIGVFAGDYPYEAFNGESDPVETGIEQPEDFRIRWTGEVDNSTSVMEIERVAGGLTGTNAVVGVSSWEGKPAVRLVPTSTSAHPSMRFGIPESARSLGTILGSLHFDSPGQPTSSYVRKIQANVQPHEETDMVPNIPGSYELRLLIHDRPSGSAAVWYGNGPAGNGYGDAWWTDIGIFAGDYDGEVFSGDTPDYGRDNYTWTGERNNSTSIKTRWL